MPARQIAVHPEAIAEARAAVEWYRERNISVADAFLAELDRAVDRIAEHPQTWPRYVRGTRHYLLRRFPFSVVYRQVNGKIEIIAIAYGRRRPGYWKGRLS